jgi:hypothetical protein
MRHPDEQNGSPSHASFPSRTPLPQAPGMVVEVVTQPAGPQASQQLGSAEAQRPEAAQRAVVVTLHFGRLPARQQVTVSGRPHVDRLTHARTLLAQPDDSSPSATRCAITARAQSAWSPAKAAVAQSHAAAIAARAATSAAASSAS